MINSSEIVKNISMSFCLPIFLCLVSFSVCSATFSFSVKEEQPAGTYVGQLTGVDPAGTYSISSDCACAHFFQYDTQSGTIKTTAVIDREALVSSDITLKFSGTDSSHQKVLIVIDVTIVDINDQAPTFSVSSFTITIAEGMGEQSFDLPSWSDGDSGDNAVLKRVQLVDMEDQNWPFQPELQTIGSFQKVILRITDSLDREQRARYGLTVEIEDKGHPSLKGTLALTIIVQDVNDNSPSFTSAPYSFSIPESVSVPHTIATILATDPDEGDNGRVQYSLSHSINLQTFSIHVSSGLLSLVRAVDYENCPFIAPSTKGYTFTLTAQDSGSSPRSTSTSVTVTVTDVNDNAPTLAFYSPHMDSSGVVRLQENLPVHSYAATIIVDDRDSGDNGIVDVSIREGAFNRFKLEETNGILILTADQIDREETASYRVGITARDRGTPPLETNKTLVIEILDVNDNAPSFTKALYTASIAEDAVIGKDVVDVRANDPDFGANGTVTYRITSQTGGENFKVSPSTGRVSTIQQLDADTTTRHVLNITASDGGVPSLAGYTLVEITVTDVNDNSPSFTTPCPVTCEVSESLAVGAAVCTVAATDRDSGVNGAVTHSVTGRFFAIDADTGAVTLAEALDYESTTRHQVTVTARDGGVPARSTTCELVVRVTDENDEAPVFDPSSYSTSLPEGVIYGRLLQVSATDADAGDTVVYSITSGAGNEFQISDGGVISNRVKLYVSTQSRYTLTVSAVDTAGNTAAKSASVSISVLQNSDYLPVFSDGLVESSIAENVPSGTNVLTLSATTAKSCTLSYSISSSSVPFSVNPTSGAITTTSSPDHEVTQFYSFQATATCNGVNGYAVVRVVITDENDNSPVCEGVGEEVEVSEDAPVGSTVYTLVCSDADSAENGEITYSTNSNFFSVSAITGAVTVSRGLDRETTPRHTVSVSVCDKGTPSLCSSLSLSIRLLDVNDHTPQFTPPLVFYVSEAVKVNHELGRVQAYDADEGPNAALSFSLLNTVPEFALFGSGQVIVERLLDYEKVDRYFLNVRVSDGGTPALANSTILTVVVEDANDNAPIFQDTETEFSIAEDTAVPYEITQLRATDKDSGVFGEVSYALLNYGAVFGVNKTTGVLTLESELDYESLMKEYRVRVQASDGGSPPLVTTATITITVLDCNDNAPVFSQNPYTVILPETTAVGSSVVTLKASDADGPLNSQITFSFAHNQQFFQLNPQTGVITTRRVLDYETAPLFNISVLATDSGTPTPLTGASSVLVDLSDANDNPPIFVSDIIEIGVVESTKPSTVILTVEATDADSGLNGKISYTLTSNPDNLFSIQSTTGNLVLLQKLASSSTVYTVKVTATDHGFPAKSAVQTIKITVIEVNNNSPIFVDGVSGVWVEENVAIGTPLFTVRATDADSGPAGVVHYNLTSPLMAVDRTSGVVRTIAAIDREEQSEIVVRVCATDQASPVSQQLGSCKEVTVRVSDVNDNAPSFEGSSRNVPVHESISPGTEFSKIKATDPDAGENGTITFSITSPSPCVTINPTTGALTLTSAVDYETDPTPCSFTVQAADNGKPQHASSMEFFLVVIDDNDNTPVFTNPPAQRTVYFGEDTGVNAVVFTAAATDADSGANGEVVFSLSPPVDQFTIDASTGEIRVVTTITTSFKTSVTVRAEDRGSPSLSSFMIVKFEYAKENSAPVCPSTLHLSRSEGLPVGSIVHIMSCYDLDFGDRGALTYSFLNGNYHSTFSISDHGKIILATSLDYETVTSYSLLILAADGGNPPLMATAVVEVAVENENDNAPVFGSSEEVVEVRQEVAVGTVVFTASASDPDGDSVSFLLGTAQSEKCTGYFTIGSLDGKIKVANSLATFPIQQTNLCNLTITATDGVHSSDMAVILIILDSDSSSPAFYSDGSFTVSSSGTVFGAVGAVDTDPTDTQLFYSLQSRKRASRYSVDAESGVVTCPGGGCTSADLNVLASGRSLSTTKTVSVSVVSSSAPVVFSRDNYNFQVLESSTVGSDVGAIPLSSTLDSLSIQGGNYNRSFHIDSTGHLTVNRSLDFETWSSYNLTIRATVSSMSVFTSVLINIIDINDNSPVFLPAFTSFEVDSNIGVGETVGAVTATDADSGNYGRVQYFLGSPSNYFSVSRDRGDITVSGSLESTRVDEIRVMVQARDQGVPSLASNLMLVVMRINTVPTAPVFKKSSYSFSAYVDSTANTPVGQVEVVSGRSDVQFSFEPPSSLFSVYAMSGVVVQRGSIDSSAEIHEARVRATSVLDPSVHSSIDITFTIIQSICSPNPCLNGGECVDKVSDFTCKCKPKTAGRTCECRDEECSNQGTCFYNSTLTACLCADGTVRTDCLSPSSGSRWLFVAVAAGVALVLVILVILVVCTLRVRRKRRERKKADTEFDNAVSGAPGEPHRRARGQDNIRMNPLVHLPNLDLDTKGYDPDYGNVYTNHEYQLDSPHYSVHSGSVHTPRSFHYATTPPSDSGRSSQCTEAVIFRKLEQVDVLPGDQLRRDKDSGLAGSLKSLCHFDTNSQLDYLVDWGPKVNNLRNVLDLEGDTAEGNEDGPVKEEFV